MPRYHFHVFDGTDEPDREGMALSDLSEAKREALKLIGQIVLDAGARHDCGEAWNVTVADADDMILLRLDCILTEPKVTDRAATKLVF